MLHLDLVANSIFDLYLTKASIWHRFNVRSRPPRAASNWRRECRPIHNSALPRAYRDLYTAASREPASLSTTTHVARRWRVESPYSLRKGRHGQEIDRSHIQCRKATNFEARLTCVLPSDDSPYLRTASIRPGAPWALFSRRILASASLARRWDDVEEAKMSPRGTTRLRNEKWRPSPYQSISTIRTLGPELPPRTATVDRQVRDRLSFLSRFTPTAWLNAHPVIQLGALRFKHDRHRSRSPRAMFTCYAAVKVRAYCLLA